MRNRMLLGCLCAIGLAAVGDAAPEPSIVSKSWELTFRYHDPERIAVNVPGRDKPVTYWYMRYTVENRTEAEHDFYPTFTIVTDTLKVYESEIGVSPEAFQAVKRVWNDALLVEASQIGGKLLVGEDRARRGVAIWPDIDPEARQFTVYVQGLSGEIARLRNPAYDPSQPEKGRNQRFFTLRKTLAVPYGLPGGPSSRDAATPKRLSDEPRWVMR